MVNLKSFLVIWLLGLGVAGCHYSTGCTGLPPAQCIFTQDTVNNRSEGIAITDDKLDSTRSYTYARQDIRMDSLLPSLCRAGVKIDSAFFVASYLCADARGPLPVVVLHARDTSMGGRGFTSGATGRLACAGQLVRYFPYH